MPKLMEKRDWIPTVANVSEHDSAMPKSRSAHDFIGYCGKFNPEYRSTAEIMRELREGEEERRPVADVLIGAYAMQKGGLITRNEDDFRSLYPGLNIFNPVKANGALNP